MSANLLYAFMTFLLSVCALGFTRKMYPRGKLDISLFDIVVGLVYCLTYGPSSSRSPSKTLIDTRRKLEEFWAKSGVQTDVKKQNNDEMEHENNPKDLSNTNFENNAIAFLSVRTAFDLYLKVLRLSEGTEVILSAITIPDMVKIIKEHKLVPVPIDMDMKTLEIKMDQFRDAFNEKTGLVLIAHIYGSQMQNFQQILDISHENGIPVFEDCAEAFTSLNYCGNPDSDISAFSFGTIKTATAFGGCLTKVKDRDIYNKLKSEESKMENQGSFTFFKKLLKYFFLRIINEPYFYGFLADLCKVINVNHDQIITASIRGFSGGDFFQKIRKQAPAPMLALMHRQLKKYDPENVRRRRKKSLEVVKALKSTIKVPGIDAKFHTFWLFPISVADPQRFIIVCRANGFDATAGATQLKVCPAPEGKPSATECQSYLDNVIYLPVDKDMPSSDVLALVRTVNSLAIKLSQDKKQN